MFDIYLFVAAIFEANAAAKTLLVENATEPQQLRVIKRCELILNVVQRLQPALSTIMNNTTHEKSTRGQGDSSHVITGSVSNAMNFPSTIYGLPRDENSLVYIRTPYTVKTYKSQVSIQPANSTVQKPSDLSYLIPYIKNGRTLRSEHSIMYNTPHKNRNVAEPAIKNETSPRNLSSIRQHLFSRDSFSIHSDFDIAEESMDLTATLEKITSSSTSENATFSSRQFSEDVSSASVNKELVFNIVEKLCQTSGPEAESCLSKTALTEKMSECAISGGGDASLIMESRQKLNSVRPANSNKIQRSTSEQREV